MSRKSNRRTVRDILKLFLALLIAAIIVILGVHSPLTFHASKRLKIVATKTMEKIHITSHLLHDNIQSISKNNFSTYETTYPNNTYSKKNFTSIDANFTDISNTIENEFVEMNSTSINGSLHLLTTFLKGTNGLSEAGVRKRLVKSVPDIDYSKITPHTISGKNLSFDEIHKAIDDGKMVPSASHFVLPFVKPQLEFHHLVCILSGYWVFKPKRLFLWYNEKPEGEYWNYLKSNISDFENKVIMVHRPVVDKIYANPVKVRKHRADVVRLEALLVFGGAYFDLDVITLKSMDTLRNYSFTIGREHGSGLCNGVMVSAPNSTFLRLWHLAYQVFDDNAWATHSVTLPNFMATKLPYYVHVEEDSMDRPNWMETHLIYGQKRNWNWKKNYCMHLWYRYHQKQYNFASIKLVDSMLGDMFRHVLYGDARLNLGVKVPYPKFELDRKVLDNSKIKLRRILTRNGVQFNNSYKWVTTPSVPSNEFDYHTPAGKKLTMEDFLPLIHEKDAKIPNALHYILPSVKPELEYQHYLSMISAIWITNPKRVFLWYSQKPSGRWWLELGKNVTEFEEKVIMVHRSFPNNVYKIKLKEETHKSDIMRLEALLTVGGIFINLNVITLKSFANLRNSDCVIGRTSDKMLSNDFIMSTPNNLFIALWHLTYQLFIAAKRDVFAFTIPLLISKDFPNLVTITAGEFCREKPDNIVNLTSNKITEILRTNKRIICLPKTTRITYSNATLSVDIATSKLLEFLTLSRKSTWY